MAAFTYVFMLLGLLLAVYINYPAPTHMSANLVAWKTTASKTIIFNKNRVFYKDQPGTKPVAPVLVCLHGFPTSSYDWLKVWPALLHKFSRVIAPDFLGFGFSDKPVEHEYSITEQADLVEHILHYQRVTEVHLLAHDYGDTVAQELLARYEDRLKEGTPKLIIKSVCLLNGGIFPETNFPRVLQQALLIPYVGPVLSRLSNIYTFQRGFGEVFGPRTQPTEPEYHDFWALIRKNDGNLVMSSLLQYIPERAANKYRWTGVLQKTKVPVHVVYGPADPVNPPGFVDFYKEVIPSPSISVLEGHIGHYPQWEDSAECMSAYFTFLKTLPFVGNEVKPQPTPNITELHKKTGKLPPPKVVLDKMKAREEQALREKIQRDHAKQTSGDPVKKSDEKPDPKEQIKKSSEEPAPKPSVKQPALKEPAVKEPAPKPDVKEPAQKINEKQATEEKAQEHVENINKDKSNSENEAKTDKTIPKQKQATTDKSKQESQAKPTAQARKDDVKTKKQNTKKAGEKPPSTSNKKTENVETPPKPQMATKPVVEKAPADKPKTPTPDADRQPSNKKPDNKDKVKPQAKVKPVKPVVKDDNIKIKDDHVKPKLDTKEKIEKKPGV